MSYARSSVNAAASSNRDGEVTGIDLVAKHVCGDLACLVWVERGRTQAAGGADPVSISLRVTSVFRREDGTWKLVRRHTDPIAAPCPAATVINARTHAARFKPRPV